MIDSAVLAMRADKFHVHGPESIRNGNDQSAIVALDGLSPGSCSCLTAEETKWETVS